MNGHPINSWCHVNGTMWLRDLLPLDFPRARVLTFGWDARSHTSGPLPTHSLHEHAQQLVSALAVLREAHPRRALALVGHCTGGTLIKEAAIEARLSRGTAQEQWAALADATAGILFFAAPHTGFAYDDADVTRVVHECRAAGTQANERGLRDLVARSSWLASQNHLFSSVPGLKIACVHQREVTSTELFGRRLVCAVGQWIGSLLIGLLRW